VAAISKKKGRGEKKGSIFGVGPERSPIKGLAVLTSNAHGATSWKSQNRWLTTQRAEKKVIKVLEKEWNRRTKEGFGTIRSREKPYRTKPITAGLDKLVHKGILIH